MNDTETGPPLRVVCLIETEDWLITHWWARLSVASTYERLIWQSVN